MKKLSIIKVSVFDRNDVEMTAITINGGGILFVRKDYIVKKCRNLGLALSDFLGNPSGFTVNSEEVKLRKEGEVYSYTTTTGEEKKTKPMNQDTWQIGSFDLAQTAEASIMANAASKLAERLEAKFGAVLNVELESDSDEFDESDSSEEYQAEPIIEESEAAI